MKAAINLPLSYYFLLRVTTNFKGTKNLIQESISFQLQECSINLTQKLRLDDSSVQFNVDYQTSWYLEKNINH